VWRQDQSSFSQFFPPRTGLGQPVESIRIDDCIAGEPLQGQLLARGGEAKRTASLPPDPKEKPYEFFCWTILSQPRAKKQRAIPRQGFSDEICPALTSTNIAIWRRNECDLGLGSRNRRYQRARNCKCHKAGSNAERSSRGETGRPVVARSAADDDYRTDGPLVRVRLTPREPGTSVRLGEYGNTPRDDRRPWQPNIDQTDEACVPQRWCQIGAKLRESQHDSQVSSECAPIGCARVTVDT